MTSQPDVVPTVYGSQTGLRKCSIDYRHIFRQILKHLWFQVLYRSGATAWARWRLARHNGTIVVTLHRVLDDNRFRATSSPQGMIVRRNTFQRAIEYLSKTIELVSLEEGTHFTPGLRMAVTFDDGWIDNFDIAAPELLQRNIPMCIFLCSDMIGKMSPFWPEVANSIWSVAADSSSLEHFRLLLRHFGVMDNIDSQDAFLTLLKHLDSADRTQILDALTHHFFPRQYDTDATMTWKQIHILRDKGITFGSHTAQHEILTHLSASMRNLELSRSRNKLFEQLGQQIDFFSYPNGDWNVACRESVKENGYTAAFITSPGLWCSSTDPYSIPRINVSEGRLTGFTGTFSAATLNYFLFWLPYRANQREKRAGRTHRSSSYLISAIGPNRSTENRYE